MQANLTNNAPAIVRYVRTYESIPQLIENYGNLAEYARRRFSCSPQVAALVRETLEARTARKGGAK